jgi:hypothetical protein
MSQCHDTYEIPARTRRPRPVPVAAQCHDEYEVPAPAPTVRTIRTGTTGRTGAPTGRPQPVKV